MKYYSTQRPVVPGSFPKPQGNKVLDIVNFDDRMAVPEIGGRPAWGYVEYEKPLSPELEKSYELVAEQMKSNFLAIKDLLAGYTPKQRGFVSNDEIELIRSMLQLDRMDLLAVQNLRDFTVLYMDNLMRRESVDDTYMQNMDRMSAITFVIDCRKVELGGAI